MTELYCLTILEARNQNESGGKAVSPLNIQGVKFHVSFLVSSSLRFFLVCRYISHLSSCMTFSV